MAECPRCRQQVGSLHPVPPEVITQDVFELLGREETERELVACDACVRELMEDPSEE